MIKISFISGLLGRDPPEREPDPPEQVSAPRPESKPEPSPVLSLPPEHALNKLWSLHREQGGVSPPPLLRLWEPGQDPPPGLETQDWPRLQMMATLSANQRLTQAKPKQEGEAPPATPAQAAVHGKDGYVAGLFPRKAERKFAAGDYGQVDYNNLNLVHNVAQGDVICRIIPHSRSAGEDVAGKDAASPGRTQRCPPPGRDAQLWEDGCALLAAQSGHAEFAGRSFQVKPVMDIEGDVDYSERNISFVGDVHIHGDLFSGFAVRAMGSVTVDGAVEACSIEAGGNVTVVRGVVGNEQAVIRAQRSIYTKYLENSRVYARDSLQADRIVNCEVYGDGAVQVRTGRGTIIGVSQLLRREVRPCNASLCEGKLRFT